MYKNEQLTREYMQELATAINGALNEGKKPGPIGFALLVYEHGRPGISNYISNSNREDMITALRESADRLEGNEDFPTAESLK